MHIENRLSYIRLSMTAKRFCAAALVIALCSLLIAGCSQANRNEVSGKSKLTHIVLFDLKEPTEKNIKFVKEQLESLKEIKEVRDLKVGVNVVESDRAYDIALVMTFDTLKDMESYRDNPKHKDDVMAKTIPYFKAIVSSDFY